MSTILPNTVLANNTTLPADPVPVLVGDGLTLGDTLKIGGPYLYFNANVLRVGDSPNPIILGCSGQIHARQEGGNATIRLTTATNGHAHGGFLAFDLFSGTFAAPGPTPIGQFGAVLGLGYDGSAVAHSPEILLQSTEPWTPTAHGSEIQVWLVANGTTQQVKFFTFTPGGFVSNGGLQTFGANDSAGPGYRTVRVPNS